jgi:hypothetical protein
MALNPVMYEGPARRTVTPPSEEERDRVRRGVTPKPLIDPYWYSEDLAKDPVMVSWVDFGQDETEMRVRRPF